MNGTDSQGDSAAPNVTGAVRIRRLAELLVFLFLIVPPMVLAQFAYKQERATFGLVAWATIARDLALVSLIVFFLWRNGERAVEIGWRWKDRWRDVPLGIALYGPFALTAVLMERGFRALGLAAPPPSAASFLLPKGEADFVLAGILVAIVALSEETIFRGYLLLRIEGIGWRAPAAVLASAVVFSIGHGYEGSAGMATVGMMGVLFALVYIWRKSLVAPITMHFLQDLVAILILPLTSGK